MNMVRAPYQVLVFPFRFVSEDEIQYAIFRRRDRGFWQGIAGGGEEGENILKAAQRETFEEAGISPNCRFIELESSAAVPASEFEGHERWGEEVKTIPEYCFGVEVRSSKLKLSREHTEYRWVSYDKAMELLRWEGNRNALSELNQRLLSGIDLKFSGK